MGATRRTKEPGTKRPQEAKGAAPGCPSAASCDADCAETSRRGGYDAEALLGAAQRIEDARRGLRDALAGRGDRFEWVDSVALRPRRDVREARGAAVEAERVADDEGRRLGFHLTLGRAVWVSERMQQRVRQLVAQRREDAATRPAVVYDDDMARLLVVPAECRRVVAFGPRPQLDAGNR